MGNTRQPVTFDITPFVIAQMPFQRGQLCNVTITKRKDRDSTRYFDQIATSIGCLPMGVQLPAVAWLVPGNTEAVVENILKSDGVC